MRISDWSSDVCSSDLIAFREVADPVDRTYPSAYLANDDGGYYFRALGHRLDGEAETGAPGRARQLAEHFRPVWERARPCTEKSEEPPSELQSTMRNSYDVFCLKKKPTTPFAHTVS